MTLQTKLPDQTDTIVALSSAAGSAARAIVRMSGRRAAAIASHLCPDFDKDSLSKGSFAHGDLRLPGFHAPIPADVFYFRAPTTYTGQDVIEIHTIGCPPLVDVLIAECLNAGARGAHAGEFTMRAFLAGKLDLTRAEAVAAVIDATRPDDLKHALKQLAGGMANPMKELREDILNLLADVEAGLDFTEEGIHFVSTEDLLLRLAKGLAYVTLLRKQLEQRAVGQRPFRVVLAGPPNAGKSSLFNALLGQDAALVSAEPGTTRDYLDKCITIDGMALRLIDTAGTRDAVDAIESSAQSLGKEQTYDADLVLWCNPSDAEPLTPPAVLVPLWHIATKADLAVTPPDGVPTSAATGHGLTELRDRLAQQVRHASHAPLAPSLSRCRHHVDETLQHLRQAHAIVLHGEMQELLALQLRLALEELGAMAGAVYTDDLLDRIFSRFCIGK